MILFCTLGATQSNHQCNNHQFTNGLESFLDSSYVPAKLLRYSFRGNTYTILRITILQKVRKFAIPIHITNAEDWVSVEGVKCTIKFGKFLDDASINPTAPALS